MRSRLVFGCVFTQDVTVFAFCAPSSVSPRLCRHNGLENYDLEWPRPVVVGCALDLDSTPRTIQFSVDGRWPETPEFQDRCKFPPSPPRLSGHFMLIRPLGGVDGDDVSET